MIEQGEDTQAKPVINVETIVAGQTTRYKIDAEMFNALASNAILSSILHRQAPKLSPQWRKDQLIRTAVKAVFIAQGDAILESMFGSKNHPKPGKDDDLLDWYMRTFIGVAVWNLTQSGTLTLLGVVDEQSNIDVNQIFTRPNATTTGDKSRDETGLS